MNSAKTRHAAEVLEAAALKLIAEGDKEVESFYLSVQSTLTLAKQEKIKVPLEWRDVPGAWFFTEGALRKYGELEAAFAGFRIEATGGDSPVLGMLRASRNAS